MSKRIFIIIVFFTLLFTYPFFKEGYFETHDGEWAIVRLAEMVREVRDLQFPPRWSDYLNHGHGYPLFLFTYPLPFYLGIAFFLTGISLTSTIKILFVGSVLVSALGMYFYAKRYWGIFGSLISSILYIVVPYRLTDLYIRGSVGESISFAVFPWLLWCADKHIYNKNSGFLIPTLFTLLVISHNASALIFLIILFFYLAINLYKNKKDMIRVLTPFFYGLLLSSYFLLPVLFEKQYIYLGTQPLADKNLHFANISEIIFPNSSSSVKPPLFLGYAHIFIILASLLFIGKIKNKLIKKVTIFSLVCLIVLLFLLFKPSIFIWKIPLIGIIDFPWRVLIGVAFFSSFLGGIISQFRHQKLLGFIIFLLVVSLYLPFTKTRNHFIRDDSYYETNDATTTSKDELMPIWVKQKPTQRQKEKVIITDGQVSDLFYTSNDIEFHLLSNSNQDIVVNTIYFPGWKFFIDGKETTVNPTQNQGLISFKVTQGDHMIKGKFTRTYLRLIADSISIIGMGFILLYTAEYFKNKYK